MIKGLLVAIFLVNTVLAQEELRDPRVVVRFQRLTGHVGGWKDHVVDHIIPLCAGGADKVWNMQWQTVEIAKQKDIIEKRECALLRANRKRWPLE